MRLTDAAWIIPLLEAHLKGETIQICNNLTSLWADMAPNGVYRFSEKENYRIKPKVAEYRLYCYVFTQGVYCVERNTRAVGAPTHLRQVEQAVGEGKITWLTDWLPLPNQE